MASPVGLFFHRRAPLSAANATSSGACLVASFRAMGTGARIRLMAAADDGAAIDWVWAKAMVSARGSRVYGFLLCCDDCFHRSAVNGTQFCRF